MSGYRARLWSKWFTQSELMRMSVTEPHSEVAGTGLGALKNITGCSLHSKETSGTSRGFKQLNKSISCIKRLAGRLFNLPSFSNKDIKVNRDFLPKPVE